MRPGSITERSPLIPSPSSFCGSVRRTAGRVSFCGSISMSKSIRSPDALRRRHLDSALVAVGLILSMVRIALGRSNTWLVWRNAPALGSARGRTTVSGGASGLGRGWCISRQRTQVVRVSGRACTEVPNVAHEGEARRCRRWPPQLMSVYLCDLGPAGFRLDNLSKVNPAVAHPGLSGVGWPRTAWLCFHRVV